MCCAIIVFSTDVAIGAVVPQAVVPASSGKAASAVTTPESLSSPGAFARARYRTPLKEICPNPFIIQKDWLAQAEQGGLYQLIGAGGRMSTGRYQGALGSTGIELLILEGGRGVGMGDAETAYSALYMGNSRAGGVRPHLAAHDLDNAFIFSRRFPAVGVVAMLDRSPSVLFWDRATYPTGFHSVEDLKAFAASGRGKIYISTTRRSFGRYLVSRGVPKDVFIEGFRGDGENFVLNNGHWLNQGTATNEVFKFENGAGWHKPIGFLSIADLGYDIYPSMLAVAASRLPELERCLARIVPLLQQAQVDYILQPAEVNDLLFRFNQAGYGAPWWHTSRELLDSAVRVQREQKIVSNGSNDTLGDFDLDRVAKLLEVIRGTLDVRAKPGVQAADVVTNRFIDPSVRLP